MKFRLMSRDSVRVGMCYFGLDMDEVWRQVHAGKEEIDAKIASVVCAPIVRVEYGEFFWRDDTKNPPREAYVNFPINHMHADCVSAEGFAALAVHALDPPGMVLERAPNTKTQKYLSMNL